MISPCSHQCLGYLGLQSRLPNIRHPIETMGMHTQLEPSKGCLVLDHDIHKIQQSQDNFWYIQPQNSAITMFLIGVLWLPKHFHRFSPKHVHPGQSSKTHLLRGPKESCSPVENWWNWTVWKMNMDENTWKMYLDEFAVKHAGFP